MKLKQIFMSRCTYGANEGKIIGSIEFQNEVGEVRLVLTDMQCHQILQVCAQALQEQAAQAASSLVGAILEFSQPVNTLIAAKEGFSF